MCRSIKKLTMVSLLGVMMLTMVTGCIKILEDRTPIYRLVGWRYEVEVVPASRQPDRFFGATALDLDTQVADFTLEVTFGTNGFEVVPTDQLVDPSYQVQIEAKMVAEGDYDPVTQHLLFYRTTGLLEDISGLGVTVDAQDNSPDQHGIDLRDILTFAGTTQSDLDDGSGDLENYGAETHTIIHSDFDLDEDGDVDLRDFATFQQTFGYQAFYRVFTGPLRNMLGAS